MEEAEGAVLAAARTARSQREQAYQDYRAGERDAGQVFVMGPGEAKIEFEKAFKRQKAMQKRLIKGETADKMTKNQMIARVRKFYQNQPAA